MTIPKDRPVLTPEQLQVGIIKRTMLPFKEGDRVVLLDSSYHRNNERDVFAHRGASGHVLTCGLDQKIGGYGSSYGEFDLLVKFDHRAVRHHVRSLDVIHEEDWPD